MTLAGAVRVVLAACLQQQTVGRVCNSLGYDSGACDHLLRAYLFDHASTACEVNAGCQQRLHTFFFDALSPAREAGRIDGQFGLQIGLATEELPVRVLHLGVDLRLIGGIEGLLQVQQSGHRVHNQGWTATTVSEPYREGALDLGTAAKRDQPPSRTLQSACLQITYGI